MMEKIQMKTPIVEMDGDEMTRILWKEVKEKLILPYVDLKSDYYDLGLLHRNATEDQVTFDAANAAMKYGVAVKCATITPNRKRMEEYPELKEMYPSPNATIRSIMDGTVFRSPILLDSILPLVRNWKKPITIARHSYGDVYKAVEMKCDKPGSAYLLFEDEEGNCEKKLIYKSEGNAIFLGQHNKESSIRSFARSCFAYAAEQKQDLWFSAKDTISKTYDASFREIFEEEYEMYKERFEALGIHYFYSLIDDAVSRVMRSEGGFIWACKNYDGDVMSDMVSTCFGSLAMMTSVLVTPNGQYEFEAAHGTITRHYYKYLKGEKTSTNSVATIFVWALGLEKRGEMDQLEDLQRFGRLLRKSTMDVLNEGILTKDLAILVKDREKVKAVDTFEFIDEIAEKLNSLRNNGL